MSIKYVVNVTILNLLLASATCSSERTFTPANPPHQRLVSTRRRPWLGYAEETNTPSDLFILQ